MTKNPILNALSATLYISLIASGIYYAPKFEGQADFVLIPIAMLSLFVLSAAVMAYIFCLKPIRLYLDGEKDEAVSLFIKTILYFGGITLVLFCLAFLISTGHFF